MKAQLSLAAIIVLVMTMVAPALVRDSRAEEPEYLLGRFVVCMKIRDREPLGITDTFDKDTSKVYLFIEMTDVAKETNIKIQWLFEGKEAAIIDLPIGKSNRWRTYSSKVIGKRHGNWEVRLLDSQDRLLKTLKFTVK